MNTIQVKSERSVFQENKKYMPLLFVFLCILTLAIVWGFKKEQVPYIALMCSIFIPAAGVIFQDSTKQGERTSKFDADALQLIEAYSKIKEESSPDYLQIYHLAYLLSSIARKSQTNVYFDRHLARLSVFLHEIDAFIRNHINSFNLQEQANIRQALIDFIGVLEKMPRA